MRELHADSGLMWDWTGAGARIESIGDLDDLIQADLAEAVIDLRFESPVKIHLAGAGVAQFEARLLPALGSKVMTWCHYRCADASITSMVSGIPKVDAPDPDDGLELDVQAGVDVVRATSEVHRAAADVRVAWATARAVRGSVRPTA